MKNCFKILFVVFITSLFFRIDNVRAEYSATVINPNGASCELKSNSTGLCFYKDKNLNSIVSGVLWLDTGDKVTVISDEEFPVKENDTCSDYYVYTSFFYESKQTTYNGYYCHAALDKDTKLTDELKEEFKSLGFPESYFEDLAILKSAHPNWIFKSVNTGLDFDEAVKGELVGDRSLIELSSSNNYAYLSKDLMSFDYINDTFIAYDRKNSSNPFYRVNYDTVAYYMDPRNFLKDMYIFQFNGLGFDESVSDEDYKRIISSALNGDYLNKFVDDFLSAGKISKVSPSYLASLSRQEIANGEKPGTAINGEYNGMYNFYNIGATSSDNPVFNGLNYAALTDEATMRPWDTEYKAIVGGALWMGDKYISAGQDTSYFKRFNVVYNYLISNNKNNDPYLNYHHQYMTNVLAPSTEAITTYKSYNLSNLLDSEFIFYIPIYNNMPDKTSLPTESGWPNNYLNKLVINDKEVADFDSEVFEYNYYLDINTPNIKIDAKSISNTAKIDGLGEFNIEENTTLKITVTAQNKSVKEYIINIILTGEKKELEENEKIEEVKIDIVDVLNNAGIKNGDKYITGLILGSDINNLKVKINNINDKVLVIFKDGLGNEKVSGNIKTGDKLIIKANDEEREYELVLYGDVDGDGDITAIDYVRIRKYIMNTISLNDSYFEASDVNKDGVVDSIDYVRIRKYIMNTAHIEQ